MDGGCAIGTGLRLSLPHPAQGSSPDPSPLYPGLHLQPFPTTAQFSSPVPPHPAPGSLSPFGAPLAPRGRRTGMSPSPLPPDPHPRSPRGLRAPSRLRGRGGPGAGRGRRRGRRRRRAANGGGAAGAAPGIGAAAAAAAGAEPEPGARCRGHAGGDGDGGGGAGAAAAGGRGGDGGGGEGLPGAELGLQVRSGAAQGERPPRAPPPGAVQRRGAPGAARPPAAARRHRHAVSTGGRGAGSLRGWERGREKGGDPRRDPRRCPARCRGEDAGGEEEEEEEGGEGRGVGASCGGTPSRGVPVGRSPWVPKSRPRSPPRAPTLAPQRRAFLLLSSPPALLLPSPAALLPQLCPDKSPFPAPWNPEPCPGSRHRELRGDPGRAAGRGGSHRSGCLELRGRMLLFESGCFCWKRSLGSSEGLWLCAGGCSRRLLPKNSARGGFGALGRRWQPARLLAAAAGHGVYL